MRKTHPAIVDSDFKFLMMDHPQMVMYLRKCARETLLIIANFSDKTVNMELPAELDGFTWERILTNRESTIPSLERKDSWLPWEAEVYQIKL